VLYNIKDIKVTINSLILSHIVVVVISKN